MESHKGADAEGNLTEVVMAEVERAYGRSNDCDGQGGKHVE